jgi:hypothetical protein
MYVLPKNEIPIWSEIQNFEKKIEKERIAQCDSVLVLPPYQPPCLL